MTVTTSPAVSPADRVNRSLRAQSRTAARRSATAALATMAVTVVIVLAVWQSIVSFSGLSPYVAKGPADVLAYFTTAADAAANRTHVFGALLTTLRDLVVGFSAGLAAAVLLAICFQLWSGLESAFMPVALLLASVPLISLAPLIIVLTGRSSMAVAVIGGIVVLFPSLVNIQTGLRSVSPETVDLITAYGGSPLTVIMRAAIPSALPALFSAARVSVPGGITGALIAEWLATGEGLGSTIQQAIPRAQFTELWASVAVVTLTSLILYNLVRVAETLVLARMGASRS